MKYLGMGSRIRAFREQKGLSIQDLAKKAKLTKAELELIEVEQDQPPIGTLIKISKAMNINVADIFRDRPPPKKTYEIVRGGKRRKPEEKSKRTKVNVFDYAYELLTTPSDEKHLDAYMIDLPPGHKKPIGKKVSHAGEEFLYILEGEMHGEIGGEKIKVEAGDSLYLRSSSPHVFYNPSSKRAKAVAVVYPF
jgi:transcriptional regulator with XRE-family HTH domain